MRVDRYLTTEESYSQYGEDALLARLLAGTRGGTCVEVGAFDGVSLSNTLLFEKRGWKCVLVEQFPSWDEKLGRTRHATVCACAAGDAPGEASLISAEGVGMLSTLGDDQSQVDRLRKTGKPMYSVRVRVETLNTILTGAGIDRIDFITIDVEGNEATVLRGFDLRRWAPRIIIEDNSAGRDMRVRNAMRASGYRRFLRTGCNDWYARAPWFGWYYIRSSVCIVLGRAMRSVRERGAGTR